MTSKEPTDYSRALTSLRTALNWNQAKLARVAGVHPNVISDFERGQRNFDRRDLEEMAGLMGLPPEAADWALNFVRPVRQVASAPGQPAGGGAAADRAHIERLSLRSGELSAQFTRSLLSSLTFQGRALEVRQRAAVLWQRLKRRAPSQRRSLVEDAPEFGNWGLCELLCKESIKAAADNADHARELAELALLVAELTPGEASWCWRLEGYAWAHVGNARRVRSDLPGAEEAFDRARKLWDAGAPGDPGLLDQALVPGLEASLRIDQYRLAEAAALLDRALAADRGALRRHLLLSRARLLEWDGDYEGALATLRQASPLATAEDDLRLHWMLQLNSALNLCHLGRYAEAEVMLPRIQALTMQLENELDALRLLWLEGRISAGLGRSEHSLIALSRLRAEFAARGITYDAALATLELAMPYLERGRTREVKKLAREMAPIFRARGSTAKLSLRSNCSAKLLKRNWRL